MAQIYPLHILVASIAGLMNRQQGEILECQVEENRVLGEQLQGRRLRLTGDQRRRLAAKWTYTKKRVGRPGLMKAIAALIVRMAREKTTLGEPRTTNG